MENDKFHHSQLIVQGSFHQGSLRFGNNIGKQCVANCLVALIHGKVKMVDKWDQAYLDNILIEGNDLYSLIHGTNDHLLVSDLPSTIEVAGKIMNCDRKESYAAVIDFQQSIDFSVFPNALPLDQALQQSLIDVDGCFVSVKESTSAVIKQNNKLYLFDSHARNPFGLPDGCGSSIILELKNVEHLYNLLLEFVKFDNSEQFEVTGISIHSNFDDDIVMQISQYVQDNEGEICTIEQHRNDLLDSGEEITVEEQECLDVEYKGIHSNEIFDFKPTDYKLRRKLCAILAIPFKFVSKAGNYRQVLQMGAPLTTKSIRRDGNCFFRAISYTASQRQEYHYDVRKAIINHLITHKEKFVSFINSSSVEEHITRRNMSDKNTWATAVEIIAAADLLQTDIYTYTDGKWIKYSSSQIEQSHQINDKAIYLHHLGDHYDVVTHVKQKTHSAKKRTCDFIYPAKSKKRKIERQREQYKTNKTYRLSLLSKRKERYENDLKRKSADRYASDINYREGLKKRSKLKYKTDKSFRITKKYASVHMYATAICVIWWPI